MSACKNSKSIVLMFSGRNKNWNDSTESIQKQKISKLTKSDASLKIDQVNFLLLQPEALKAEKRTAAAATAAAAAVPETPRPAQEAKAEDKEIPESAILWVRAKRSRSGELAVLRVMVSRPQSRTFLQDVYGDEGRGGARSVEGIVQLDLMQIIENSELDPKDSVPWKYLRRYRVYKEEKGKFLVTWLRSIHFHYSRILGRRRMILTCPNCTFVVKTSVRHVNTLRTNRSACALSVLGLCGLPYLLFLFKDVIHMCPLCNVYLGFCPAFKYPRKADVVTDVITPVSLTNLLKMRARMAQTYRKTIQVIQNARRTVR